MPAAGFEPTIPASERRQPTPYIARPLLPAYDIPIFDYT
jgi:hypothetical protein